MVVAHHQTSEYWFGSYTEVNQKITDDEANNKGLKVSEPLSKSEDDLKHPSKRSNQGFFPKKSMRVNH
jgi:hypothetical protein